MNTRSCTQHINRIGAIKYLLGSESVVIEIVVIRAYVTRITRVSFSSMERVSKFPISHPQSLVNPTHLSMYASFTVDEVDQPSGLILRFQQDKRLYALSRQLKIYIF